MPSVELTSKIHPAEPAKQPKVIFLRHFSKLVCFSTLFLIFVGGMVTSTESGLAVPDWPLSYGTLFPPMVGGVFYEHGHRMVAATVGFLTLCLAVSLGFWEKRRWVKRLGFITLGAVILQGILGGITVKFFLPTPVSVTHALLAQTFFIFTIILAYSQSHERTLRVQSDEAAVDTSFLKLILGFTVFVYIQLIFGAVMRHTGSGLAVPDFPTMGGLWWPSLSEEMLAGINDWRFERNLDPVNAQQVIFHLCHRGGAIVIVLVLAALMKSATKFTKSHRQIFLTTLCLTFLVAVQVFLGISTVLTEKAPRLTSLHVATGAAILGLSVLLFLRAAPMEWSLLKKQLKHE